MLYKIWLIESSLSIIIQYHKLSIITKNAVKIVSENVYIRLVLIVWLTNAFEMLLNISFCGKTLKTGSFEISIIQEPELKKRNNFELLIKPLVEWRSTNFIVWNYWIIQQLCPYHEAFTNLLVRLHVFFVSMWILSKSSQWKTLFPLIVCYICTCKNNETLNPVCYT